MSAYTDTIDFYKYQLEEVHVHLKADEYEKAAKQFFDTMTMFEAEPQPNDNNTISAEEWDLRGQKLMQMQIDCRHTVEALQKWLEAHKIDG